MDPEGNNPPAPNAPPPYQVVGRYTLKAGKAAQKFWALDPAQAQYALAVQGAVGAQYAVEVSVSPAVTPTIFGHEFSTLVMPPVVGVFDILISFSDDYDKLTKTELTADNLDRKYNSVLIMGKPTKEEMPLAVDQRREARIAFAVPIPDGKDLWEGTLTLEANLKSGDKKSITLKLKVNKYECVDDLWVFFVPNGTTAWPKTAYAWSKVKLNGMDSQPVGGAKVRVSVVRDNAGHYTDINRRVDIETLDDGFVGTRDRKVLGLPIDWPVIFTVTKDGYVMRAHMLRITAKEVKNNKEPLDTPATRTEISFMKIGEASLKGKRFVLDPGHGVVYADKDNPRCQEWMSTNMIAERIQAILTGRFDVNPADIAWTRSAGFGLVSPDEMNDKPAPQRGKRRYRFDLADPTKWRIRPNKGTDIVADERLHKLSDLLYTDLDDKGAPKISESDRAKLISDNDDTVEAAAKRTLTAFHAAWRVTDDTFTWDSGTSAFTFEIERKLASGKWKDAGTGSVGWDTAARNYIFHFNIPSPVAGESGPGHQHPKLHIDENDWFAVTPGMMRRLEDRCARWSLKHEIGGGADFPGKARTTMEAHDALNYMKQWCQWSNDRPANDPLLIRPSHATDPLGQHCLDPNGTMGWDVRERRKFFSTVASDFIFSIHENALDPGLEQIGYAGVIAANNPLPDQKRIARTFVKYMDPLDQGLYSHGIYPHTTAALVLGADPPGDHRTKYVYFELDFMTTHDKDGDYQYEGMLDDDYLSRVAEEAVAAAVEWLLLRQDKTTFDSIKW